MDIVFYPIKFFADFLTYSVFKITAHTLLGEAVNFFIFDTVKIFILLGVIIFLISLVRTYLPPEKIRAVLIKKNIFFSHILAALFGIITPFCTCSAIPLFLGFVQAGIPLGVTFSFLVASPMINEVALILLFGMFGYKIALLYIVSGLIIAIISGIIIGRLKVENLVADFVWQNQTKNANFHGQTMTKKERMAYAKDYTKEIIIKVWPYIIIGIGVGAWIHGYIPADFLAQYAGADKWYAVPLAVIIGIPLYSNAAGIIPLVSALTEKGVATGTTLAFMMAVTALSLPEFMILKKVMKIKLILIFAGIVGFGIILTGYLFNFILK
ncbi:MAG: permease [Candidatus Buchananbacteria bacterium]